MILPGQSGKANRRKRWIICADGTWNEPEQTDQGMPSPTNVSKLAAAVLPYDQNGVSQTVFYHVGVGERGGNLDQLFGNGIRTLGAQLPSSNEKLSQAAKNRQELVVDYQPKNVLDFAKKYPKLTE